MMINWQCKVFNELSVHELYAILQLRNEVFVVEQNCVYQDADNKDQLSYHLTGWKNDALIANARLLPPGVAFVEPSIGRVVTSPNYRHTGAGKTLMTLAIENCKKIFGGSAVKIGAQVYLTKFYSSFGFKQTGEIYLEDGIEHIKMVLFF